MTTIKTMLLLASLMMLGQAMNAQNHPYSPLALEGAHWWVIHNYEQFPYTIYDSYQYVIRGDSVLNDKNYKKVFYRELQDNYPHLIEYEILAGLVRDDTITHIVYVLNINFYHLESFFCPVEQEFPLYDFSLNTSDTVNFCMTNNFGTLIVDNIDYEFRYGQERKILFVNAEEPFIEGIGSGYGVFEWGLGSKGKNNNSKGWGFWLENYCLGTDEECGCQWVGIEDLKNQYGISIYPNPALIGNPVRISGFVANIDASANIEVFDLTGRLLISAATKQTDFIFNSPEKPGVYFVIVSNPMFKQSLKMVVR